MKVFVATRAGQGARANDFCWSRDGELVGFGTECDGEGVDGHCGCRRSLAGLDSHQSTTTFMVVEQDLGPEGLQAALLRSLEAGGWLVVMSHEEATRQAATDAAELARLAQKFPVGTVCERRGARICARTPGAGEAR